ncbi:MAG: uncharacterized protein PWP58_448 [Bacillota bacterium]|jgi:uncharacterized protein|nr:uncharacterized protein [Bacillota bacterium]MDK2882112.1 uncharacterized protein [Bacillota bacterium]
MPSTLGQVHTFTCLGKHLALDVESGSLHQIDEVTYEILRLYPEKQRSEIIAALAPRFGVQTVEEALGEVDEAVAEGTLFSPPALTSWEPSGPPTVKALCLHVAHDCNLRCRYCFGDTGDFGGRRELMPADVARRAVDFLLAGSGSRFLCEVDFFGGEPLLNLPVVREAVNYARQQGEKQGKRFKFTLTTNGVLLTEEVRHELADLGISLVLSLDGRPEVHDRMRVDVGGQGSYRRILPHILEAIAADPEGDWWVRGTFTRENLDFAADARHLVEIGINRFSLEPVVALPSEPYALREEDLPALYAQYEELARLYEERARAGRPFQFFHFEIDLNHGPCLSKRFTGCGAGHEYFAVAPNGDLYPCHQFVGREEYRLGSVTSGVNRPDLLEEFRRTTLFTKSNCRTCWARYFCGGGCHANAQLFHGHIRRPYELGCSLEKKRVECALYLKAALELPASGGDDSRAGDSA